ncbi:hypothetical protein [Pseudomonas putida]|uniref:hypothetical protein n=1 Tax=Pseudomonas putida TaxID=303 RepID=UPI00300F4FAD
MPAIRLHPSVVLLLTLATTISGWRALDGATLSLRDLIGGIDQVVAEAIGRIEQLAEQINRSVLNVRDVSDQTSAASEQTAASSGELEQLGQQWRGMVGRFNI